MPLAAWCASVGGMPGGPEWIIILIVVLVLFGGAQLPKLAKNLGKAQKEFKDGLADGQKPGEVSSNTTNTTPSSPDDAE